MSWIPQVTLSCPVFLWGSWGKSDNNNRLYVVYDKSWTKKGLCPCPNSYWFPWWYSISSSANTLWPTGLASGNVKFNKYCWPFSCVKQWCTSGDSAKGLHSVRSQTIENKYMNRMVSMWEGSIIEKNISGVCRKGHSDFKSDDQGRPQCKHGI